MIAWNDVMGFRIFFSEMEFEKGIISDIFKQLLIFTFLNAQIMQNKVTKSAPIIMQICLLCDIIKADKCPQGVMQMSPFHYKC